MFNKIIFLVLICLISISLGKKTIESYFICTEEDLGEYINKVIYKEIKPKKFFLEVDPNCLIHREPKAIAISYFATGAYIDQKFNKHTLMGGMDAYVIFHKHFNNLIPTGSGCENL